MGRHANRRIIGMKKNYVKITVLICALITVAVALGGILFTIIQVNAANSVFMKKVTKTENTFDVSNIVIENTEEAESTLVVFDAYRFLTSRTDPDIGHYGRYSYLDGFSAEVIESTEFKNISVSITPEVEFYNLEAGEVFLQDSGDGQVVVFGSGTSAIGYTVYSEDGYTAIIAAPVIYEIGEDGVEITESYEFGIAEAENVEEDQTELDLEAQSKYDEIIDDYRMYDKISVIDTGWQTSYALIIDNSSIAMPFTDIEIGLYEYDTYIFHPLAYVFSNYMYAYIIFVAALIVLLALSIILMRRMYVNRMNFESRTQNLTRSFAHELKTPLAVTKAYVENWDLVEEKDRADVSAKINAEVDHMSKMVNTLLNLSKMDSGEIKLDLQEVELFELGKACYRHMEKIAKEKNMTVEFKKDNDDGEYMVMADLDMMNMVISNFLSNAIKYGKEKVEVSLQTSGSNITFKVTNDGETISSKDLKKIWDLFYKKDKARTDRMSSNGVGLAVNKSILELHKAKFGAESASGLTTFWFEMKKAKE